MNTNVLIIFLFNVFLISESLGRKRVNVRQTVPIYSDVLIDQTQKRQIYREEVLPHAGGKIPDSAFETDRLMLNRLQKEGIAIPDGVILQQRNPQVHPYPLGDTRPVLKVHPTSDQRYTPPEGQYYHYIEPLTSIETTYPVPSITNDVLTFNPKVLENIHLPVYRQFSLPNPLLTDTPFKSTPETDSRPLQALATANLHMNRLPQWNLAASFPIQSNPSISNILYGPTAQGILDAPAVNRFSTFHGNANFRSIHQ